jgi:antitoxin StbD
MEILFSGHTVSMSEFKKNPAAVLRQAKNRPVAVLNHNKAAFYMLEPALMEAILEELVDQELLEKVRARLVSNSVPVDVNIEDI